MKDKQIGFRVTQEEYELIHEAILDMTIKDNKRISMSALLLRLVREYVNGSEPIKEEVKIDSKDNEQEVKQVKEEPKGYFDGLNLDFDK